MTPEALDLLARQLAGQVRHNLCTPFLSLTYQERREVERLVAKILMNNGHAKEKP